jgi:two-component system chemotaxis response regulator CheB
VLTGTGSDGSLGVEAIKRRGGTVIAQDEETSDFFGMPGAAIEAGAVDFVLPLGQISQALTSLVAERRGGAT